MGDIETLMEFRQQNFELWLDFVKNNDDYCITGYLKEDCNCMICEEVQE